jgi:N-acetylglucosaminyldiphosphoundecaprenol N-acetyl-beta-D-mannosaminyltransferase
MAQVAESPAATLAADGPSVPERQPDFDRPLIAILGLPFDAITVAEAVDRIRAAAFSGRRCFVSTPNLNFAIAARKDPAFRDSILCSDLSLVDGMPLVWIARLLGLAVPERVSGADVFEALQGHAGPPIAVYVFGGPDGVAAAAGERINRRGGGLRCVGSDGGGFGSLDSLSSDERIERINRSGARFVIVALGAAKGQAWIERNASRLHAPVLSHLGAVVNFAAGSLMRAPRWLRASGLEWAWRIKEEPALWRRYATDARAALALLLARVLPDAIGSRPPRSSLTPVGRVTVATTAEASTIALQGSWRGDPAGLRHALADCAGRSAPLIVDLHGVEDVGAPLIALLLVAEGWFASRSGMTVVGASERVARAFRRKMASELL